MSDWIPVNEATRKFGLSRATLYRLIAEGRVKRAKRAGDIRAYVSSGDLREATTLKVVAPATPPLTEQSARRRRRR
jgi:predicted DNA-binding transcriptional regulator AlpA